MLEENFGVDIKKDNPLKVLEEMHLRNIEESGYQDLDILHDINKVSFQVTSFGKYTVPSTNYTNFYEYMSHMEGQADASLGLKAGPSRNKTETFTEETKVDVVIPKKSFGKLYQSLTRDFVPRTVRISCVGYSKDDPVRAYEDADIRAFYHLKSGENALNVKVAATDQGLESRGIDAKHRDALACHEILDDLGVKYREEILGEGNEAIISDMAVDIEE